MTFQNIFYNTYDMDVKVFYDRRSIIAAYGREPRTPRWKVPCLVFLRTDWPSDINCALSTVQRIARISARLNLIRATAAITKSVHRIAELGLPRNWNRKRIRSRDK